MMCLSCKKPFCWLCLKAISPSDPYGHFNDRGGPGGCLGQLFEGVEEDDDDDDDDGDDLEDFWADLLLDRPVDDDDD